MRGTVPWAWSPGLYRTRESKMAVEQALPGPSFAPARGSGEANAYVPVLTSLQ